MTHTSFIETTVMVVLFVPAIVLYLVIIICLVRDALKGLI